MEMGAINHYIEDLPLNMTLFQIMPGILIFI